MAPDPGSSTGDFDPDLAPYLEVQIVALDPTGSLVASFTTDAAETDASETTRVDATDEDYIVNFHTDSYGPDEEAIYRIVVRRKSDDAVYGFADVQIFAKTKQVKSMVVDDTFGLKDGHTLPVKFRIEVGAEPEPGFLRLCRKQPPNWEPLSDGRAEMWYNLSGPDFVYVFDGYDLAPLTDYTLIYYADEWPGNNPGAEIHKATSDGSGELHFAGSIDLGHDLPQSPDLNYYNSSGAKIWLVPSEDYDADGQKMLYWNPADYLFEEWRITYRYDTDAP